MSSPASALQTLVDRLSAHDALDRLPLDWRRYPTHVAADVLGALAAVLEQEPLPAQDENYGLQGGELLPSGAPRLIVVQGDPRAGKDELGLYLRRRYSRVSGVMTSTAIRAECNQFLQPYGHEITETNKSVDAYRHLLQAWGMARQEEDADYWPGRALPQVRLAWDRGSHLVIITGLRWPHDAQRYRDAGGLIWRVERPGNPYQAEHLAETGFRDVPATFFDAVVRNPTEGDLEPFYRNVDEALLSACRNHPDSDSQTT